MIYEYECTKCDVRAEIQKRVSDCTKTELCRTCFSPLERVYSAPIKFDEFKEYYSEDCKTYISSRNQEKKELRRKGLVLYADTPGYEKWKPKIKEYAEKKRKGYL